MMKKIFTKGFIAVAMVAVVGFVSSCKDYNDEIMAEYRGQDAELKLTDADLQNQINKHVKDMLDSLKNVEERRGALEDSLEKYILKAEEIYATQDELGDSISDVRKDLKDSINNAILALADVYVKQSDYNAKVKELMAADSLLKETIAGLQKKDSLLDGNIADLQKKDTLLNERIDSIIKTFATIDSLNVVKSDVTDLLSKAADLQRQANLNSAEIETIKDIIANIKQCTDCDSLAAITAALEAKVDTLAGIEYTKNLADAAYERAAKHADDALNAALENYVKPNIDNIIDIITDLVGSVEANKDSIADLRSDLNELNDLIVENKKAIEALNSRVDDLEDKVDDLKDGMKNRISSVLVQGAYSPVVGYFNIPFGMKSNILAAYKGSALSSAIQFPFKAVDGSVEAFTQDIASKLNSETIDEIGDGYAGKLYLTINPAEVDLDSVDFALVNSQDDLAPVKLDSVVVSSDVLKFGYTRAGAPLYEATATITDVNAASLDLNLGDYKDILNDLKNRKINLTEIANTLYSSVNEIADANAVRASWTDSLGEHTVYSDFAVAAVAVKPLSFNTFAAIDDIDKISGLDRVYNAIDNAINRINVDIEFGPFDSIKVTLDKLNLNEDAFDIVINDSIEIKGQTYEVQGLNDLYIVVDGNKHYIQIDSAVQVSTKDTTIIFTYNKNLAPEILNIENTVNGQFDQLQNVIDQVNTMLAQINGIETEINQSIADAKEDIKNEIHKYLDKLNNKLCNVINSAKDKVNAAMFVKATDGFGVLSQSKNMPTVIENGAVLVPTTYTAELVVPVYKKFVAITAVDGSTDNLAAVNTGDLNKVLDGGVRAVEFNGESGKTYEVTYAALDYTGHVSTAKYYVTVK
ncbi:MAG: hypothetical protein IKJ42_06670 [Bacteroidaceae bacterium]|nr:hypothetical protein [Bacteroidaceae bacterium]